MGAPVNGHGVGTPGGGTMSYNLYLNAERMVRAYVGDLEEKMVQLRADLERQQREDARRLERTVTALIGPRERTRAEMIDDWRERTGKPLSALSKAARVHRNDVYRWRRGAIPETSVMAERIREVLDSGR